MSLLPSLFERKVPFAFDEIINAMNEGSPGWGNVRIDVRETPVEYIVTADLPGFKKNEISVELSSQMLSIAAEREEKEEEKKEEYLIRERRYCSVQRSIPLSGAGSPENVKAEFKDGVLQVHVKKTPEKQAKRIQIQ